ncbi:AAA family ATPase [bacterium]|nr:AAA family ATPase [bacterium]
MKQNTFFPENEDRQTERISRDAPLAERSRPQTLDEIFGQEALLGADAPLRHAIERDQVPSMILWGPPGSGKTTIAHVVASVTRSQFLRLSATDSGVKDFRRVIEQAREIQATHGRQTILFIDEIHRWNKSQQDALLPYVESGLITLIGATTENPSFEVNSALLSRVTVYTLNLLEEADLEKIVNHGLATLRQEGSDVEAEEEAIQAFVRIGNGDARCALTALEQTVRYFKQGKESLHLRVDDVAKVVQEKRIVYDKAGEEHYNLISALHKSMRGSDPQGTLYWLVRMLEAGEDPLYVARRIVRFAAEDVGLADPNALLLANAAKDTYHFLGSPEGELALAEAAVYMATAPKSHSLYAGYNKVRESIKKKGYLPVPLHIRNAPTQLMKEMKYGKGYKYAHDFADAIVEQDYLPEAIRDETFYTPTGRGFEQKIAQRMKEWQDLIQNNRKEDEDKKGE